MSKDSFQVGTFILLLCLGVWIFAIHVKVLDNQKELNKITSTYTQLDISRQRARFVDLQIEELSAGLMDASILAQTAMGITKSNSKDEWITGLTTTQIDSIRINCEPANYTNIANVLKKKELELYGNNTPYE